MNNLNSNNTTTSKRLDSLDILRGFDLFLLVFLQPILVSLSRHLDYPLLNSIIYHFEHEAWEGFRFWDIVMPLFLFMSGVSMPFSFSKYKECADKNAIYKKIIKRFIILFVLGMIVQGNLLGLDFNKIYLYNNTLQAIASGYLIAAMIFLHLSLRNQIISTTLLLLVYWLPITFAGDFTQTGNFAYKVDLLIMGGFRGDPTYTWIWSSLTFGATVMLGVFAGKLVKENKNKPLKTTIYLFAIGASLIIAGIAWSWQMPIIKRIWTSSMTLLSGGYCFLLMALFYYIIDYKGHIKGLNWLKIYGTNSILAYLLGETINFRCIAHSVFYGLEHHMGQYYTVWLTFCNFLIIFLILRHLYKAKIFIKI